MKEKDLFENKLKKNQKWWNDIYQSIYMEGFRDGQLNMIDRLRSSFNDESEDDLK